MFKHEILHFSVATTLKVILAILQQTVSLQGMSELINSTLHILSEPYTTIQLLTFVHVKCLTYIQ